MNGNENYIVVFVHKFYHLLHLPIHVYLHKTSENADSMVDMHHVITYFERCQIIDGKRFAHFNAAARNNPVESVENLVVGITAHFRIMVYETVLYSKTGTEVHILDIKGVQYAFEPLDLSRFVAEHIYTVPVFHPVFQIFSKKFEILIERRLGRNIESHRRHIFMPQRRVRTDDTPSEIPYQRKIRLFPIYFDSIYPQYRILGNKRKEPAFFHIGFIPR